jgi:hypothetical protein
MTIQNKRVVIGESKLDDEERQGSKMSKFGTGVSPNNMLELFRDNREMEIGVSITDLGNNSKIYGENKSKNYGSGMKLS